MRWWRDDQLEQHVRALHPLLVPDSPTSTASLPQLTGRRVASRGAGFAILDVRSRTRAAGQRALVTPEHARDVRMVAPVQLVWVASARWSDTAWIARRRTVRRAQLDVAARVVHFEQMLGLVRLQLRLLPRSRPLATFIPSRARSRIRSDSNSATLARALNSNRPTGSVGSWIEPPGLSLTFRLVSSSRMCRASGSDRASRSS
jgi:hypothetical protein